MEAERDIIQARADLGAAELKAEVVAAHLPRIKVHVLYHLNQCPGR